MKRATFIPGHVASAVAELLHALAYEYRTYSGRDPSEAEAAVATIAAADAVNRLLDLPVAEGLQHPDYLAALALSHRRWLVMEDSYASKHERDACRLVDAVLYGHRFDDIPLLWHVNGEPRATRPTEAEFSAIMESPQ